jgi:flagellar motor switch protein FliM
VGDVLSQAEVESLLGAIEAGVRPLRPPVASGARELAGALPREKVAAFDGQHAQRVGNDQLRVLRSLHEKLGRNFATALSGLLRSIVGVKVASVEQRTYSEFVCGLENPTCFNLLRAEPLDGNLILDMDPSILFPIIDRLLGGGTEPGPIVRRPLTEIELRLVSRVTSLFLEEMRRAWANFVELTLSVERVECDPQLVQVVPADEVVALVRFELTLQEVRGQMNLCLPFSSIERIGEKLWGKSQPQIRRRSTTPMNITPVSIEPIGRSDEGALVELVVELAESKIATSELAGLRAGDIITTEKDIREPLDVLVQGVPRFRAKPGAYKGRKAIRIEQTIDSSISQAARPMMP